MTKVNALLSFAALVFTFTSPAASAGNAAQSQADPAAALAPVPRAGPSPNVLLPEAAAPGTAPAGRAPAAMLSLEKKDKAQRPPLGPASGQEPPPMPFAPPGNPPRP